MKSNWHINIVILLGALINAVTGGILIYFSFQGHSSVGLVIGVILPLAALSFYGDGYSRFKGVLKYDYKCKHVFRPSRNIFYSLLCLAVLFFIFQWFQDGQIKFQVEQFLFFILVTMMFIIPNMLLQLGYYKFLKKLKNK